MVKLTPKSKLKLAIARFIIACRRNKLSDEAILKMVKEKYESKR